MKRSLKLTLALAALQLFAALPAAHGLTAAGRRPTTTQGGTRRARRRAPEALTPGVWGGEHIRFEVTEGGASVEYDCAHETVEGRIVLDGRGRFNVYGLHYAEHGGPVRRGEEAAGYRVRLSGRVGGSLMKLTVTRADTRKVVGTFDLARDREPLLVKCR
ncbi:MAG: hypothetical protein JOZ02_13125 [Acidobacteria bacterium]|nr:hypothetical protein [Acidobacteriota bacterium]